MTRSVIRFTLSVTLAASGALGVGAFAAPAKASLAELVRLNGAALFGGNVQVDEKKGRFTLTFPDGGLFEKGFVCKGKGGPGVVSEATRVKDIAVRKTLIDGAAGKFSLVGLSGGTALSRFMLEDEYRISFKLRIPSILRNSSFNWYLNRTGRSYIQLVFLQNAVVVEGGRKKSVASSRDSRFRGRPARWFDRKSNGVPVEIGFKNGVLKVRVHTAVGTKKKEGELVDVLTLEGISAPKQGRLALTFDRLSFLLSDLRIEGKLPRSWLEEEIARLEKAGRLVTEDPATAKPKPAKAEGKPGEHRDKPEKNETEEGPDIGAPDPEADIEL